jgi:pyrroline-5-carboxylate reductase
MMEILAKINGILNPNAIIISLAPKFTIQKMTDALGGFSYIARIKPALHRSSTKDSTRFVIPLP